MGQNTPHLTREHSGKWIATLTSEIYCAACELCVQFLGMVVLKTKTRRNFLLTICTVFMVSLEYTFGAEISLWKYIALFSDNFSIIFICCAFFVIYYVCLLSPLVHNNGNGWSVEYNQQPVQNFIDALFSGHWRMNGGTTGVWMWFIFILSLKEIQTPFLSSLIICLV